MTDIAKACLTEALEAAKRLTAGTRQPDVEDSAYVAMLAQVSLAESAARIAAALSRQPAATPEGEVTEAMIEAGEAVLQNGYATDTWEKTVRGIYAAMRAALHPDGLDAQIQAHERNMAEQQAWLEAAAAPAEATPKETPAPALRMEIADWRARYDAEHARAERLAAVERWRGRLARGGGQVKVYIVFYSNGSDDWGIDGLFQTEKQAQARVAERRKHESERPAHSLREGYNYDYQEHEVELDAAEGEGHA